VIEFFKSRRKQTNYSRAATQLASSLTLSKPRCKKIGIGAPRKSLTVRDHPYAITNRYYVFVFRKIYIFHNKIFLRVKKSGECTPLFMCGPRKLLSLGSLNRASICARTAVNALVGIDNVLAVLLADSLNGALFSASAASDAIISDLVCHCDTSVSCCGYIVSQIL
jgi:hypothetical protein